MIDIYVQQLLHSIDAHASVLFFAYVEYFVLLGGGEGSHLVGEE